MKKASSKHRDDNRQIASQVYQSAEHSFYIDTWYFKPVLQFAEERGLDPDEMFRRMGCEKKLIYSNTLPIDYVYLDRLFLYLLEKKENPFIGIELGVSKNMLANHLLDFMVRSSTTISEAFEIIEEYNTTLSNFFFLTKSISNDLFIVEFPAEPGWISDYPVSSRLLIDSVVTFIYKLAEELTNGRVTPFKIAMGNQLLKTSPHEFITRTGFKNEFVYSKGYDAIYYTQIQQQNEVFSSNKEALDAMISFALSKPKVADITNKISARVRWQLVCMGKKALEADIGLIARRNNLSVRTLQRLLKKEGTSFRKIFNIVKLGIMQNKASQ